MWTIGSTETTWSLRLNKLTSPEEQRTCPLDTPEDKWESWFWSGGEHFVWIKKWIPCNPLKDIIDGNRSSQLLISSLWQQERMVGTFHPKFWWKLILVFGQRSSFHDIQGGRLGVGVSAVQERRKGGEIQIKKFSPACDSNYLRPWWIIDHDYL